MRQVSLELIDRGTNETGSTAPLDLDEERVGCVAVFELDESVDAVAAERVLLANRTGLQVRHLLEQVTGRVYSGDFRAFHQSGFFHHTLKIRYLVKIVKGFSLSRRFQRLLNLPLTVKIMAAAMADMAFRGVRDGDWPDAILPEQKE